MKTAPARRLRAGVAIPAAFALVAFVTFVWLGTWQIQRKAWKEGLIETLEQRLPLRRPISRRVSGGPSLIRLTMSSAM